MEDYRSVAWRDHENVLELREIEKYLQNEIVRQEEEFRETMLKN